MQKFQQFIWDFYKEHKRDLPWRNTADPYRIFISEIMLQQTQVSRVIEKYEQWIKVFPDIKSLAESSLSEILKVWSGLGYNRRALYVQKTAQIIVKEHGGILPEETKILETFPGIGKNTAGSLVVFAYNKPVIFIETNIRRVFIHYFFSDQTIVHDNQILPIIEQTLDKRNPREWYYALMDYGTYLSKTIENPNRKSRHYTKQSPLKGSIREARGRILKFLTKNQSISISELERKTDVEPERFQKACKQLLQEEFITQKDETMMIKI